MASVFLSDLELMTFEEIKSKLDEMQVRYSLRKDTSREYLLQVLKHHLKKAHQTPTSTKSLQDEVLKDTHSQNRIQFSQSHEDTNLLRSIKGSRFSVGGISKNLLSSEDLFTDYTPDSRVNQAFEPLSQHKDYRNQPMSHNKQGYTSEGNYRNQEKDGSANVNKKISYFEGWHDEPTRRSFGCVEHVADLIEQNRTCYSDTQLLKGPIEVNFNELFREKERQLASSPSKGVNRRSGVSSNNTSLIGQQANPLVYESQVNRKSDKRLFWVFITSVSLLIFLFYLAVLLPSYFFGHRTPIVFTNSDSI